MSHHATCTRTAARLPGTRRIGRARACIVAFIAAVASSAALAGCGTAAGAALPAYLEGVNAAFGIGAEGGEKPALVRRAAGGLVLAYAGSRSGERHIYIRRSEDGVRWSEPDVVSPGAHADQAPALAEDGAGRLHLFFVSNRSGETQAAYHVVEGAEGWSAATPIAGLAGAQDLAVSAGSTGLMLIAEVMGAGLLAATSGDGVTWSKAAEVAPAGAEPAACALPDGRTLVAYQLEGKIWLQAGAALKWGKATEAATGASRLRDPGLAWSGTTGLLAYSEKGESGMALHARSLNSTFKPSTADAPNAGPGDHRGVAIALDHNGSRTFAWGMKTPSGQQGVMVSIH